jgi:hypothetical protein
VGTGAGGGGGGALPLDAIERELSRAQAEHRAAVREASTRRTAEEAAAKAAARAAGGGAAQARTPGVVMPRDPGPGGVYSLAVAARPGAAGDASPATVKVHHDGGYAHVEVVSHTLCMFINLNLQRSN